MRLLVAGGDERFAMLAELYARRGELCDAIGFELYRDLPQVLKIPPEHAGRYGMALLPHPYCDAQGNLPAPYSAAPLPLLRVLSWMEPGGKLFCGRADDALCQKAQALGLSVYDLFADEAFIMENAVPSAEGAIHAAMSRAPFMISGSKCLIVGYGRIGRALAQRLRGLCAHVTVAARGATARAQARGDGAATIEIEDLSATLARQQLVFNTAPQLVLTAARLAALPPGALVIDLASPPYGVDLDAAQALGVQAWREPGLPGRYCPKSAAEILLRAMEAAQAKE